MMDTVPDALYFGLLLAMLWSIFWKGMALWRAAQKKEKRWFVVLLFLNSLGIFELIYLYRIQRKPLFLWMIGVGFAMLFMLIAAFGEAALKNPHFWGDY